MRTNKKAEDHRVNKNVRLAGGHGMYAASQNAEQELRRLVMAHLLFEDSFYQDGYSTTEMIASLIPQVTPDAVFDVAVQARTEQKLRHVPLLLAVEMLKYDTHKGLVANLLPRIILRPDELSEFLALYWRNDRTPVAAQAKKGLADAFYKFDEYQLAKWRGNSDAIKVRDVLRLVHPRPQNQEQAEMWGRLRRDELATPDTWEVVLSSSGNTKENWERLINDGRLGALAYLRNLRNMLNAGVKENMIRNGFKKLNPKWLLPLNYFAAVSSAPSMMREVEELMFRGYKTSDKLSGHTVLVIDVSGSMEASVSTKGSFNRMEAACAMAVMAAEVCESISVYATAGSDYHRTHQTERIAPYRGFALSNAILHSAHKLGVGGIFTRQCLEYIKASESEVDRIIVFSDSQDCDVDKRLPQPFGTTNYIIDVSSHQNGINYKGVWTAEISGWSEHFLTWIITHEGLGLSSNGN